MSQYSLLSIPPYQFLIPLRELKEVLPMPHISPVPKSPPYVLGLFPIRGELCTLLCLPTLLNFTKNLRTSSKAIILDHRIGLFAIEVVEADIISFPDRPKAPPLNLPFSQWISGIFSTQKGDFFILNFTPLQDILAS
ncbi:MAG: hypothetical protein CL916_07740 [Deltaproteobacteria bacterium]|nr:hypothetical protein [Deltaproteobacteria bacterium]